MDKYREMRIVKMKPKRPTDEQVMLIAKAGLMARGLAGPVDIRESDVPGAPE